MSCQDNFFPSFDAPVAAKQILHSAVDATLNMITGSGNGSVFDKAE